MLYFVTFTDGSTGVFTFEQVEYILMHQPEIIASYEVYEPKPEPTPTDEELIYANWLRTGGTGTIEYWRSIGSPLYYTPEPEPEPQYPSTDIKDIAFNVVGLEYPATDIKDISFSVVGEEYPATDIKDIAFSVIGEEYPATDIKNIAFIVVKPPEEPEEPEEPGEEEKEFPWVPAALIAGGVGLVVATGIGTKKTKGG